MTEPYEFLKIIDVSKLSEEAAAQEVLAMLRNACTNIRYVESAEPKMLVVAIRNYSFAEQGVG